jgi:hypothetical protein
MIIYVTTATHSYTLSPVFVSYGCEQNAAAFLKVKKEVLNCLQNAISTVCNHVSKSMEVVTIHIHDKMTMCEMI